MLFCFGDAFQGPRWGNALAMPKLARGLGVFSNWPSPRICHNALSKNVGRGLSENARLGKNLGFLKGKVSTAFANLFCLH